MFHRLLSLWQRLHQPPRIGHHRSSRVPATERRLWGRYSCELETTFQAVHPPGEARLPARVRNISAGGIQLAVNRGFETGTLLHVHLPASAVSSSSSMLASVVHVALPAEGSWVLGCSFIRELNDVELRSLL